jgi:tRNA N6-adenosine threonylcarbamoyltransferase
MLVFVPEPYDFQLLGQTLDDAAGEAYDKVARLLGLGFPGGPALDRLATAGDRTAIRFPRAATERGYDFSLSGLKTAVVRYLKAARARGEEPKLEDVAASFQEAVVEVQVDKTISAAVDKGVRKIVLGGGVVANTRLRELMSERAEQHGLELLIPPPELCTDNAAMIACAGHHRLIRGDRTPLDVGANPSLPL